MGRYANYDLTNNVIMLDYTGLTLTQEILEAATQEVIEIGKTLPGPVYEVVCLKDTKGQQAIDNEKYFELSHRVDSYVKGVIRYGVTDSYLNISLRSRTVRYSLQGTNSHIYPTLEEALTAFRRLQQAEK